MIKININGFGRIGRNFLDIYLSDNENNFVINSVNDIADYAALKHIFNVSSKNKIKIINSQITHNNEKVAFSNKRINNLNHKNVNIVIESTGKFISKKQNREHLKNGAEYVIISSPCPDADITIMPGINNADFIPAQHKIISASSCTAQAAIPIIKALEPLNIKKVMLSTIHPYTVNNALLDNPGRNLRESRSSPLSIVPANTRADIGFKSIFPEIPIITHSFKVPTIKVASLDLILKTDGNADKSKVNALLEEYSKRNPGLLSVTNKPLVSKDLENNNISSIVDTTITESNNGLIRVFSWYDNEWAYTTRLYELAKIIAEKIAK